MSGEQPKLRISIGDGASMPDPEQAGEVGWLLRYAEPTRREMLIAASVIEAYIDLATHPAGTEASVRQLRTLRRVLREERRG